MLGRSWMIMVLAVSAAFLVSIHSISPAGREGAFVSDYVMAGAR